MPAVAVLSYAEIVPEPLGLVLIISSWNFPIGELKKKKKKNSLCSIN